jgi:uncharacterized damage-inducible protein DinB
MQLSETLLPEFDQEMANTRKILERVPEDKLSWKPHEKSFSMGHLATHLASLPIWATITIENDEIDIAPSGQPPPKNEPAKSRDELLGSFDQNVAAARRALASATDERLLKDWALLSGGKTMMTAPRISVLRSYVMNHIIHHRAQLGLYLRLNDVPVPAMYLNSADEPGPGST